MQIRTRIHLTVISSILLGVFLILSLTKVLFLFHATLPPALNSSLYPFMFCVLMSVTFLLVYSISDRMEWWSSFADAIASRMPFVYEDRYKEDELGERFGIIETMLDHYNEALDISVKRENESSNRLLSLNAQLEKSVRKHASKLREAREQYRLFMELTTEAVLELDKFERITFMNPTALSLLDCDKNDIFFRKFFEVVSHGMTEECRCHDEECAFRSAIKGNAKQRLHKIWIKDKKGNSIPVSISVFPIFKDTIRVGTIVSFMDLSEAMSSNKMTEALYESTAEGCIFFSETFEPIDCNPAMVKLFKASSREEVVKNFFSFSPTYQTGDVTSEELFYEIQREASPERHKVFEWTHISADGEEIPCVVTLTSVQVNRRKVNISCIRDLREQKKAELAMHEQREQLEKILKSTPVAMAIVGNGNVVKAVNESGKALLGLNPGSKVSFENLYADEEQRAIIQEMMQSGKAVEKWPVKLYNSEGRILDTVISLHPFASEGEDATLAWIFDVTELTREKVLLNDMFWNRQTAQPDVRRAANA